MPQVHADGMTEAGAWVTDPSTGQPGVSIMDKAQITSLADELSGTALLTASGGTVVQQQITGEANSWRQNTTEKQRTRISPITWPFASPITWPFAIALLAVAAWEFAAWHMQSRRLLQ